MENINLSTKKEKKKKKKITKKKKKEKMKDFLTGVPLFTDFRLTRLPYALP